jgi:glycosyltransferase involved in cell wall biosynthesis
MKILTVIRRPMRKLKICNIGWVHSIHVERWLKWFAAKGHEISIITDVPKEIERVTIYNISERPTDKNRLERYKELQFNFYCPPLYNFNRIIRLRKLVSKIRPDIVHSHSLWYPGYLGGYLNFHPFVVTVFNGDVLWKKEDVTSWQKLRTKAALKKADLITGVSATLTNACVAHGVERKRTHVIRRGVDLKTFNIHRDKTAIRALLGLPEGRKIVLSPRNLGAFYNLERIIDLIPKIAERIRDVLFVFIWHENKNGEEFKNRAAKAGILDKVRFVGRVEHDAVPLYHRSSDIMISISDKDSGPVALQEAMACGNVPVISDLPSVRELVADKINGFLVNPSDETQIADAVITLLLNDALRAEIAERNWKIAQDKFDQEKEMQKMESLYHKLLEGGKR